jgi:flavin reductase (DIM6/NTAB) family NADH-FMN oxidoreductase RutF
MAVFCWASIRVREFSEIQSMTRAEATQSLVPAAEYLSAIAHHVASVCVITTEVDGERFGMTATAVSSVSAEPPRLLVCVNKSGMTHEKIVAIGRFAVNVLAEGQDKVAMVFAGLHGLRGDRFATGEWTTLRTGAPILVGASAAFDCVLAEVSQQSTHSVLFGDVVATQHRVGQDTLLYGARRFRQLRKVFSGLHGGQGDYL